MKKVKVAFCIPTMIIGGVETVFISTLEELLKYPEFDIRVITHAKIREALYADWLKSHPEIKTYVYYPLCNWFEDLKSRCNFFPLKQIRKICFGLYKTYRRTLCRRRAAFTDADIFIDYKNLSFFKELKNLPVPKITWVHGHAEYLTENNLADRMYIYDYIIGITDDFVRQFRQKFPEHADKVLRIYNPIDLKKMRDAAKNTERYPGKYFCQVSRLDEKQKDITTLIRAFEIFYTHNDNPDVRLLIVGGGPDEDSLKRQASKMQSAGHIIFTGPTKYPMKYMRGAMANILSTKYEGLGMVLLEAASANTPNIATDCHSGPSEVLLGGRAGILCSPGDADALARAMQVAYRGGAEIKSMTDACRRGLARFTPDKITSEIKTLILQTIKKEKYAKDINCIAVS